MRAYVAGAALFFLTAITADAQVSFSTASNLHQLINDDAYNGQLASMTGANLVVPLSSTIQSATVTVRVSHSWVGDLTIKVRSPSATVVTLVSRPGLLEPADDGNSASGGSFSANLSSAFPITFSQTAAVSAESMGAGLSDSSTVCQANGICSFIPNRGAAPAGDLNNYAGQNSAGTWTLYVGDSAAGDGGFVEGWTLSIVPTPSDLSISNTDNATIAVKNHSTTYTIVVNNIGPGPASAASVVDAFPAACASVAWTCAASAGANCHGASGTGNINASIDLAAGSQLTFSATCSVSAAASGTLSNTATVAAYPGTDPTSANDSVTDVDTIVAFDPNNDGHVDASDLTYLREYFLGSGPAPTGPADANGDASVTPLDAFFLINYLFAGGAPPL